MSRALVISVGTGIGEGEEAMESLSGALAYSINSMNPDKVYFIVSKESSKTTLPMILSKKPLEIYEVNEISSPDDIQSVFREIRPIMEEVRKRHEYVAVDYTSGTKAMTSALAMLGVLYEANVLCNVVGERRKGLVQRGTESLRTVQPIFAIMEKRMQTAIGFFNRCQYDSTLSLLDEIEKSTTELSIINRVNKLKAASKAYSTWDKFNHEEAFEHLVRLKDREFDANKRFLGMLIRAKGEEKGRFYIADLYSNAVRRGDIEGKYDDAVARFYRIIELMAQDRLKSEHGIDTSNVSVDVLPPKLKTEWESRLENGTLSIGLNDSYRLLSALGDVLGDVLQSPRIKDLLSKRNYSILAHGLTPLGYEDYEKLKNETLSIATKYVYDFERLVEDSTHPHIEQLEFLMLEGEE
jgi:CRISPR-associated protein (TIGR02710 family)